ncbi:ESPR-type extended signal peptide-containing protein, partial [Escherichia coli]
MTTHLCRGCIVCRWSFYRTVVYGLIWNCTRQAFHVCPELTRRVCK